MTDRRTGTGPAGLRDMPASVYHQDGVDPERPSLSKSIIHLLITASPAHAKAAHPKLNPQLEREDDQKFDIGTASHALLLEGDSGVHIVAADDWRTKAAKEQRDDARASGRIPLLAKDWTRVEAMCAATRAQLDAVDVDPPLFTNGQPEKTIVWEENGVLCRARLDWLRDDLRAIDDYKSTSRSANPEGWTRTTLFSIGADIQAEFYARGVEAVTGTRPEFRFCVQETQPPYALSVIALGPDVMTLARKKVDYALDVWARCLRNEQWPAYPSSVCWAELPPWEENRWLEREVREAAVHA